MLKKLLILSLAVVTVIISPHVTEPRTIDLLAGQNWAQFAGATSTEEGLLIRPLGRTIIHQDGSAGQPNPPINLVGPHLSVDGYFIIKARMEGIDNQGTLRLYGKPPIVYDQWRFETGSIAIEVSTTSIAVRIWDGSSSQSVDMREYEYAIKKDVDISLEHKKEAFLVRENGRTLGTIPDHGIFAGGEVWFGADAALGDEWMLSRLVAGGHARLVAPDSFEAERSDPNTLHNLAFAHPRKLLIGSAIEYSPLVTDSGYRKIALSEFGIITPENGLKPQFIHPQKDVYNFTEMDTLVDIALQNDMLVHGHTLVYSKSSPLWMTETPKENREKVMTDHIKTVAGHFKGRVSQWDVINEPLSSKKAPYYDERQGIEDNFWYEAMGEKYIDLAFHAAHKADPDAELYLNDYGLERDGERWDALLALIKRLKSGGVPIDGIGFESHVYGDGDYSDPSVLREHMRILASLGLKVRISEIDVTGDDEEEQVNQYLLALDACLRSPNCTGYSVWGFTDLYGSTTRSDRYPLVFGTSLLWDKELKPKPAHAALQKRFKEGK